MCRSPAFALRCQSAHAFDYEGFLDRCGILIVEGGGDISDDAQRTMMGSIVLRTIQYIVKRAPRSLPLVTLALDEANNHNLIGASQFETKAMAEFGKYGLGIHVLVQLLDFPSGQVTEQVMQICDRRIYFRCPNPKLASVLGADLEYQDWRYSYEDGK